MKKFCGLALTLALLMLLFPGTAFADSAGETTYTFRETFDNTAFPKAAKFRYTMPEGVVVNVPADKIFVMTGDKPLRAACGDGRALCMIKEYVNIDVEIIYYFEHGIRSIEYMGVCGAGDWAGAYNKEGTFSISTSDRLDGEYIYYDKNMYCNIEDESSVQAQYAIPEEDIPADARYVKLSFPNASKTPQGEYPYWSMGLAFLTVEAYNTDRPVPASTTRRPTTTTQMQTMKPLTNITTVPVTTYRPATQAPAENENTNPLLGGEPNASDSSVIETENQDGETTQSANVTQTPSQTEPTRLVAVPPSINKTGWLIGIVAMAMVLIGIAVGVYIWFERRKRSQ
jgi:hypothetical protein